MKREEMIKDLERNVGPYPNISQIAEHLGWGRDRVRAMMCDVEHIGGGRSKQYFAGDVVDRLLELRAM